MFSDIKEELFQFNYQCMMHYVIDFLFKDHRSIVQTRFVDHAVSQPAIDELIKSSKELHCVSDNAKELTCREFTTYLLRDLPDKYPHLTQVGDRLDLSEL